MVVAGSQRHLSLLARAVSPTKAVAFHIAEELHLSGRDRDPVYVAERLEQLRRVDPRLRSFVESELKAYAHPVL